MKRIIGIAIMIVAALAATAAAETVDEILDKYVEARGGMEALEKVETAKYFGKTNMQGMQVPGLLYIKRPGKMRLEFTIQGQTMIQAYNGETGWYISPFMGKTTPEKMTPEDTEEIREMADIEGPLVNPEEKGHEVELIGKEDMEGQPVYKLKLTKESGDVDHVYLDAEYYLELKTTAMRERQGAEIEVDSYSSDYKEANGLMIAHSIENKMNGQTVMQYNIDSIQFNIELPDSLFEMPEVEESETDTTDAGE
ncbi:MAG: hypothetical protein GF341_11715 [candidate division Zixibacteria bacterium]|nr:hypothetical protein [candidate division Zixibacteria bacterium]